MDGILKEMSITPNELHHSQAILEGYDKLREELLLMLALDKYIEKKKDEHDIVKEKGVEIETFRKIYSSKSVAAATAAQ